MKLLQITALIIFIAGIHIASCDSGNMAWFLQINDAVICKVEISGKPYAGVPFKFCPYCGRPITEEMKKSRKIG